MTPPAPVERTAKAALVVAVAVFSAWSWFAHGGLSAPAFDVDTFDYAQMARQVSRGEGFTMLQTFPYVLRFLSEHGVPPAPPWPDTTRFPLVGIEEAAAFAVVGPNDSGILLSGGALFVLTAIAVFLLGNRVFGSTAGVLAAIAVAIEPEQLRLGRSGLLETGAGLLLVLCTLTLVVATGSQRGRAAVLVGMLLGLAFLQRYDLLAILPVALATLVVLRRSERRSSVAWCLAGFLASTGPWLIRNLVTVGTLLGSTSIDRNLLGGVVPGDVYMAPQTMSPLHVAIDNWPAVVTKLGTGALWFWQHVGELFGSPLATWSVLVAVACPMVVRSRAARTTALFVAGAFVARALLLSLMHNELRFYASFTPLVVTLAIGTVLAAIRPLLSKLRAAEPAIAVLALLLAVFTLPSFSDSRPPAGPEPFVSLGQLLPAGTIVASDTSWNVAWYSDRPSVRFSGKWQELVGIEQSGVRIGAVVVRGPSARAFEEALSGAAGAGADLFGRGPALAGGYHLWLREDGSPALAGPPSFPPAPKPLSSSSSSSS